MKLRRFSIENVRSFLQPGEFTLDGDISILIGPNGGGKTNLLDAIVTMLRRHLMPSWISRPDTKADAPHRRVYESINATDSMTLPKHSSGSARRQRITAEIEVTRRDIDNMQAMKDAAIELMKFAETRKYAGVALAEAAEWDAATFNPGDKLSYEFLDGTFVGADKAANLFARYLALYEVDALLRQESDLTPLSTPLLYLTVNRVGGGFASSVMLSGHNDFDLKRNVDIATSRSGTSIAQLAVGRLATKFRMLLEREPARQGPSSPMIDR